MSRVPEFRIPYIEDLHPASYSLGAPVVKDIIQLGLTGKYQKARLAVTVGESLLTVCREDEHLLQIASAGPVKGPGRTPKRVNIFRRPVPTLSMHLTDKGLWVPEGADLKIVHPDGFRYFLNTIVSYAEDKQRERIRNQTC